LPVIVLILLLLLASPVSAEIRQVRSGGDLQAALSAAQPGDEIVLEAGTRFVGGFTLPAKPFGALITIRSSATLPDRRLTPADASLLPIIASGSGGPALTGVGASQWKLDGLRFESNSGGAGNIIELQDVSNVTLDRLLIIAGSTGQKRAIMGNGRHVTLTRSHIANIWTRGQDSQAFCAWDGAGPYTITDNYLEAASENVMFGGADSKAADRVPSDIVVERNHFSKPLEWKGQPRTVKNLFELKSAKRVAVRNNLFERNWTDAQNGYAILFTARNDDGGSPWAAVQDVVFEHNIVRDVENGFNVLGYDSYQASGRTTRVTIRNNLVVTAGTFLQAGGEVGTLVVDHNTVDQGYNFGLLYTGAVWPSGVDKPRLAQFAVEDLTITNTLANHNEYGLVGEEAGIGTPGLTQRTRHFRWTHNVLAGGGAQNYPVMTWRPSVEEHRRNFTSDYHLIGTSKYLKGGSDGQDLGVIWIARTRDRDRDRTPRK
jgi:Right handed beta helix region